MIYWVLLLLAIIAEVCGTSCMKLSNGFTRVWPSVLIFVFYSLSFVAITLAIKKIDISIAYAIWSALGTGAIAFIGIVAFGEKLNSLKVVGLILVIAGVIALNISSAQNR